MEIVIDWALRAVMAVVTIFVFLLGRDQKRSDELIHARAESVRENLQNELALRDLRLDEITRRLDSGSEKLSALASFAQGFSGREERLRRDIDAAARTAKHEAIDAMAPLIADLNLKKMDERLHSEKLDDIKRRLQALEAR